jgi:hypothetical protein
VEVRVQVRARKCSVLRNVQTGSGARPASNSMAWVRERTIHGVVLNQSSTGETLPYTDNKPTNTIKFGGGGGGTD